MGVFYDYLPRTVERVLRNEQGDLYIYLLDAVHRPCTWTFHSLCQRTPFLPCFILQFPLGWISVWQVLYRFDRSFTIFGKKSPEMADKFSFDLRRIKKNSFFGMWCVTWTIGQNGTVPHWHWKGQCTPDDLLAKVLGGSVGLPWSTSEHIYNAEIASPQYTIHS